MIVFTFHSRNRFERRSNYLYSIISRLRVNKRCRYSNKQIPSFLFFVSLSLSIIDTSHFLSRSPLNQSLGHNTFAARNERVIFVKLQPGCIPPGASDSLLIT